ncbi:MAG: hypothetical protein JWN17_1612 [Frankiales bacterium]|nr:hypothetical protein [Frankiales bacterium]
MSAPSSPDALPPTLPLQVEAPSDLEVGAYANMVSTWYTETDLAIDFAAVLPSEVITLDDGEAVLPRARLVSRVKLPPAQARELLQALTDALARYEAQFGPLPARTDTPRDLWTV